MRNWLSNLCLVLGVAMLTLSFGFGAPVFDLDGRQEWYQCRKERRTATLNGAYPMTERCRKLLGRSNIGFALAGGGIVLLVAARKTKKKTDG